jgi:hypothetical protein
MFQGLLKWRDGYEEEDGRLYALDFVLGIDIDRKIAYLERLKPGDLVAWQINDSSR